MGDYPEHITCPNCGKTGTKREMLVNDKIGLCTRERGGCGRFWSLESGISYGFSDVGQQQ